MNLLKARAGTLLIAIASVATPAWSVPAQVSGMPVHFGGDAETDACETTAAVANLDPKGDNFLSVRSGPGGQPYRELDRLHTGQRVTICEDKGAWLGVVYAPAKGALDCKVSTPRPQAVVYRGGPCRAGWIHKRYVRIIAG